MNIKKKDIKDGIGLKQNFIPTSIKQSFLWDFSFKISKHGKLSIIRIKDLNIKTRAKKNRFKSQTWMLATTKKLMINKTSMQWTPGIKIVSKLNVENPAFEKLSSIVLQFQTLISMPCSILSNL